MRKVKIIKPEDKYFGQVGFGEVIGFSVAVWLIEDNGDVVSRAYEKGDVEDIGKVSVYWATYLAYQRMPNQFIVYKLVEAVRRFMQRPYLMDGTILRRLRELKDAGSVNYEVTIDERTNRIYRKK